ncbi:MAG: nicotinate-nucleotide adenylyltransferase [Bacteroidia bacterium]|nr:nicotinate-nucleotide adenylyltransferase [Bacteroidia bacterium]
MKVGLFFGTFNPIHVGHMVIAGYMTEFTDLEQVWFVVSPHNPMKLKQTLLQDYHRLALVRTAIADNRKLKASNIEFSLPKPSYTIETLTHMAEKFSGQEFALILGADNLESFPQWKDYERILENHSLYVYPRLGFSGGNLTSHPKVKMTEAPLMEISSSFIRESIKNKMDVRYMLTDSVFNYIEEMHFYEKD